MPQPLLLLLLLRLCLSSLDAALVLLSAAVWQRVCVCLKVNFALWRPPVTPIRTMLAYAPASLQAEAGLRTLMGDPLPWGTPAMFSFTLGKVCASLSPSLSLSLSLFYGGGGDSYGFQVNTPSIFRGFCYLQLL